MPTLNKLPDGLQVWRVGNQAYLVSVVPGADPPIYLAWTATDSQIQDAFGPDIGVVYDETMTDQQFQSIGALVVGDRDDMVNTTDDPYRVLEEQMQRMSQVQPWLEDTEVLALIMEAMIEGHGNDWIAAMMPTTTWWRSRTEGQRAWAELYLADPMTAEQRLRSNALVVGEYMRQAGIDQAPQELVDHIAYQVTTGNWTEADWQLQVKALSDPYSGLEVDASIQALVGDSPLNTTRDQEQNVKDMILRWLGPIHGQWDQSHIAYLAGQLRNNPDAEIGFTEYLQKQRMALFRNYDNPNLTYEDIAGPWRNYVTQIWGQTPDETDPFFERLVKTNDAAANAEMLRREGLRRGNRQVINQMASGFGSTFGQVRRPL